MQLTQLVPVALVGAASAQNLTEALNSQNASLSTLSSILNGDPAFAKIVADMKNVTLFAPSNDAFTKLQSNSNATELLKDAGFVRALLSYHVLDANKTAADFTQKAQYIPTKLTNSTYTNVGGGQRLEIKAADGNKVNLFSGLRQNSSVTTPNIAYNGGTIHIIDTVLTLPGKVSETATTSNLTALSGALRTAAIVDTVDDMKDVTVFAPSNDAFGQISSYVSGLSTKDLGAVLGYHVVKGTVGYSSMLSNTTLKSSTGDDLHISVVNGNVFVNAARVTLADVLVRNGVVHVINQVLNSKNTTGALDSNAATAPPAYSGATSGPAPFTSDAPKPTTPVTTSGTSASSGLLLSGAISVAAMLGGAALFANL